MGGEGHEPPLRLSGNRRSSSTQASPSVIRASPSQSSVKRANQAACVQLTDDLLDAVVGAALDNPWPGQRECHSSEPFGTLTCANAPTPIPNSALPLGSTSNATETPALVPGVDLRPTNTFALPLVGSHAIHLAHLLTPMVLGGMGRLASPLMGVQFRGRSAMRLSCPRSLMYTKCFRARRTPRASPFRPVSRAANSNYPNYWNTSQPGLGILYYIFFLVAW